MADKSVTDVLAEVVTSAAEHAVKNAKFDVSAYGVITEKEDQHYKIAVFGGEYGIVTNHDYIVGQKVVVTALQGNFRNLIVSESNTSVEILTVKSLVTGVDSLNAEFESMKDKSQQTEDTVQDQLKNTINTWYRNGHPHTYNYPASDWKTDEEKQAHVNDIYYDKRTGICYRWVYDQDKQQYFWMEIVDAGVINALSMATSARDLATEKVRVFTDTPTAPYDVNDLWIYGGVGGALYICITARGETEKWTFSDWAVATKYTDDTTANAAVERVGALETKEADDVASLWRSMNGFNDNFGGFTNKDYTATKKQVYDNKSNIEKNASDITSLRTDLDDAKTAESNHYQDMTRKISAANTNISTLKTNVSDINKTISEITVDNFLVALNLAVNTNGELCYISKDNSEVIT
jgi:hypothetical protein